MEKITSGITGRVVGFAKKVTLELVYDFIDQRTKEIKEEFKEHKIETNQRIEKFKSLNFLMSLSESNIHLLAKLSFTLSFHFFYDKIRGE
ncbi:MAG: hypothetical protein M1169_03135 [Firmicutes bacterium]|nr:hypothetical protein [Bacillota bacterium]